MTLAQAETVLVNRLKPILYASDISLTSDVDTTPRTYLADPIATGLHAIGRWAADPTAPTTTEVAEVPNGRMSRAFLDFAELRLMETAAHWFTEVNFRQLEHGRDYAQFRQDLMVRIESKRKQVREDYPNFVGC